MIRGWRSSTRKRRKRIAKRKIDGKRWLGDCVVLFLVRKQYLTIPFGDLNSYNRKRKKAEKVDKTCYSARRTDQSGWNRCYSITIVSRIFFQSSFFTLLYEFFFRIFSTELEYVCIPDRSVDLFILVCRIFISLIN